MIAQARQRHPDLPVRQLCALLGVSRSWYYGRPLALARAERDVALRDAIERLVLDFPGYGYRRVTKALEREGWAVNHKRVYRLYRQEGLSMRLKRPRRHVMAAHRMGYKEVIFPWANLKDIENIPKEVRDGIKLTPAKTYDDIYPSAIVKESSK